MGIVDIAELLRTPRELCKTCYNWCSQEDVGEYDWPQCSESDDFDCHDYLIHNRNNCPKHLEL